MSSSSELELNPGRPQRRVSGVSFLFRGASLLAILWLISGFWNKTNTTYQMFQFAHRSMYQNQTLDQVADRSAVVQPLINAQETFDIGVSVWVKRTDSQSEQFWTENGGRDLWSTISEATGAEYNRDGTNRQWYYFASNYESSTTFQRPIFSDIVARGVRLEDKDAFFDVNFSFPTQIFRDIPQNRWNLRGSVFLIPNSPSLLDHMSSFSTSRPMKGVVPIRSYPFPLNSTYYRNHTDVDEVIDSIGFSFPLVALLEIPSRCSQAADPQETLEDISAFQDPDSYDYRKKGEIPIKYQDHVLKKHPFIITRTRLLLIDETNILNRKTFDLAHRRLLQLATDCRRAIRVTTSSNAPFWDAATGMGGCERTYRNYGNWETRLELDVPTEDGQTQKQYAYAPYLSKLTLPPAPMDLVRVPVTREKCASWSTPPENREWMNITWHLSLARRSPGKLVLAEGYRNLAENTFHEPVDLEGDEWLGKMMQGQAEMLHGWFGHTYHENSHPKRRTVVEGISYGSWITCLILGIQYWYTRTSTVSLSIPGAAISAVAALLAVYSELRDHGRHVASASLTTWIRLIQPFLMLMVVFKIELKWHSFLPSITRIPPTHAERASLRVDSKTPFSIRLAALLVIALVSYFVQPQSIYFFRTAEELTVRHRVFEAAILAFDLTGSLSQLVLNHRTGVFAGRYKLEELFRVIVHVLSPLCESMPSIFGIYTRRPGVNLEGLLGAIVHCFTAYQALALPSMKRVPVEDTSEQ